MKQDTERGTGTKGRGWMLAMVGVSLMVLFLIIAYEHGLGATPYETVDSAGRTMGFNDLFSHEHYRIIVGNMHVGGLGVYEWILIAAHLVMAGLLVACRRDGWIALYAVLQFVCFPWGLLGFLTWPCFVMGYLKESGDRESVVDMPFVQMQAGAVWLTVATIIGWRMWRSWRRL